MDHRLTTLAPKEAIARAKASVADLFADEAIDGVRLEEIRYDDDSDEWRVTIGFERPRSPHALDRLDPFWRREYKVVAIRDKTGATVAITNRSLD